MTARRPGFPAQLDTGGRTPTVVKTSVPKSRATKQGVTPTAGRSSVKPLVLPLAAAVANAVPKPAVKAAPSPTPKAAPRPVPRAVTPATASPAPGVGMDSAGIRHRMVERLVQQGLADPLVINAMSAVERHRFVDTALVGQAYEDTSLPIGLAQTISKPSVVARMIEILLGGQREAGGKLGRVLEIGTGCGYQAAVLARVSREVYSIERLRGLHDKARDNLRPLRVPNIHLIFGDGMQGFAQGAPYAGIIAAAGGDAIPQAWLDQLAPGGRLIAPMRGPSGGQQLVLVEKFGHQLKQTVLEAVHFVPLKSGIA